MRPQRSVARPASGAEPVRRIGGAGAELEEVGAAGRRDRTEGEGALAAAGAVIAHNAEVEAERSDAGPEARRDVDAGGVAEARGMGRQAGIDEAVDEARLAIGFDAEASERHAAEEVF